MDCPTGSPTPGGTPPPASPATLDAMLGGAPPRQSPADWRVLRCVASGFPTEGCSCDAMVPAEAVVAAWARERRSQRGDRFFSFRWCGQDWLAFGLRNGLVRGVYCPEHRAARDEHLALDRLEQNAAERRYRAAARALAEA